MRHGSTRRFVLITIALALVLGGVLGVVSVSRGVTAVALGEVTIVDGVSLVLIDDRYALTNGRMQIPTSTDVTGSLEWFHAHESDQGMCVYGEVVRSSLVGGGYFIAAPDDDGVWWFVSFESIQDLNQALRDRYRFEPDALGRPFPKSWIWRDLTNASVE